MPFNTITVAGAVAPTAVSTTINHYLPSKRKEVATGPSAHLSYAAGLSLIRRFLVSASHHTVEDMQSFTAQRVPHPVWIRIEDIPIPDEFLDQSAELLLKALGGPEVVGGSKWWRWRETPMKCEEIEMRVDRRNRGEDKGKVLLYVHGGAYFFGAVDTHRYQLQRYARKLKCRVVAPRYRLAPQFPFPCGIYDVISVYLYLLSQQPAESIIFGGDSAGGGMILTILTILRDHGIPLPAGAILISPWVDLCHSFPSVIGDNSKDYIPQHGFLHRPSPAWPPPTTVDFDALKDGAPLGSSSNDAAQGVISTKVPRDGDTTEPGVKPTQNTHIVIDGVDHNIIDQIQLYCPNPLLSHPFVSPIVSPSLGGLPPLLILSGGGEVLRDEQQYLAHRASSPASYPVWRGHLTTPAQKETAEKYDQIPTRVVLQVFDDCCHVVPIMSWSKPARHMYRAARTFAHWIWAAADSPPPPSRPSTTSSSSSSSSSSSPNVPAEPYTFNASLSSTRVSPTGDPAPFSVPPSILSTPPETIGVITPEPIKRWLDAKHIWDNRYAPQKHAVQNRQLLEIGNEQCEEGERPPATAAYGRRGGAEGVRRGSLGWGMWMWAGWGKKVDEKKVGQDEKKRDRVERKEEKKLDRVERKQRGEEGEEERGESRGRRSVSVGRTRTWSRSEREAGIEKARVVSEGPQVMDVGDKELR